MKRTEFIEQLNELLQSVEAEEKEEALQYYEDYLEEAGVSKEAEVPESFGTPQQVAQTVKDGLSGKFEEEAKFTERGFQGFEENRNQVDSFGGVSTSENRSYEDRREANREYEEKKRRQKMGIGIILLIIAAGIIGGPVVISVLATVLALFFCGVIVVLIGLFTAAAVGVSLLITGAVLCGVGIVKLLAAPFAGIVLIGGGLVSMSVGLLAAIAGIHLAVKILPKVFRKSIEMCKKPFQKRREKESV